MLASHILLEWTEYGVNWAKFVYICFGGQVVWKIIVTAKL